MSKRLLHLAVAALARRELSRAELARLLARKCKGDETEADIASVLDGLAARGLLDDVRTAQTFSNLRMSRHGSIRIGQELARKGVSRETIRQVLPDIASETQAARSLWQRRFGVPAADPRERARHARYLAARGFRSEIIARVICAAKDR